MGSSKPLPGTPVARTPFVVVYAVDEEHQEVVILSILHGAERRGDLE